MRGMYQELGIRNWELGTQFLRSQIAGSAEEITNVLRDTLKIASKAEWPYSCCSHGMPIQSFADLEVWKRSMLLTKDVYILVVKFPSHERFGLTSQLRRAAVSIPSNIAEGWGYGKTGRYLHHLRIARGSECELLTQLELAMRLGVTNHDRAKPVLDRADEVGRMLSGLIRSLEQRYS